MKLPLFTHVIRMQSEITIGETEADLIKIMTDIQIRQILLFINQQHNFIIDNDCIQINFAHFFLRCVN